MNIRSSGPKTAKTGLLLYLESMRLGSAAMLTGATRPTASSMPLTTVPRTWGGLLTLTPMPAREL